MVGGIRHRTCSGIKVFSWVVCKVNKEEEASVKEVRKNTLGASIVLETDFSTFSISTTELEQQSSFALVGEE